MSGLSVLCENKIQLLFLALLFIAAMTASCGMGNSLQTTLSTMTNALAKDPGLFEDCVDTLSAFDNDVCVYKSKKDIVEGDCVKRIKDLFVVTSTQLQSNDYTVLYECVAPLFSEYELHSCTYDGTVQFVFESSYGQTAYLEYSENDTLTDATFVAIETVHIKECWFAAIISD